MILGETEIEYGKHTRNVFVFFENSGTIHIDFDSDFSLQYTVNVKNKKKQIEKAKKIVAKVGPTTTVEELISLGFESDVPEKYYK